MFGPGEPEKINQREWVAKMKSLGRDFFSKTEMKTLVDLMENSGREYLTQDEWDNLGWNEKLDNFVIGVTYLTYYIGSGDVNPVPIEVRVQKCQDEWFMVSFYQDDYQDEEGEIYYDFEEYYECDGFDCLLNLLKKEANLG